MKTGPIRNVLYLFAILLTTPSISFASHGMGGEITWRCLGNGEFIFQMKFYRDCNGIPGPSSVSLSTNHPAGAIPLTKIQQNDISPDGYLVTGTAPCPTCSQGGAPTIPGLVEEFIYESAPVQLTGTPPANGWEFSWGTCCRSASTANLVNPGSQGFLLKAVMYPFNGQNTYPCYDSSPAFAEKPNVIQCTNVDLNYLHIAFDNELDSLSYSLENPVNDNGIPLQFAPGYSLNSPLPGTLSFNSSTGQMQYQPTLGGNFALVVKVSAYKCGTLVSEVYREILLSLISSCPSLSSGLPNQPPTIVPPFPDPVTGTPYSSFIDTVYAGDTVSFNSLFVDMDSFLNGNNQIVTHNSFSTQYGTGYSDPNAGCLIPPCATLSSPPPVSVPQAAANGFNWVTAPAHLGISWQCVHLENTYHFIWKAQDNYCPANAAANEIVSITVMPTTPIPAITNNGGTLKCGLTGNYSYQWFFNRLAIQGANTDSYTPIQTGIYHVLAVAPNGDGNYSDAFVYNPVGMEEALLLKGINIYPNPSENGIFQLRSKTNAGNVTYFVSDLKGSVVLSGKIMLTGKEQNETLDLSKDPQGVYLLQLTGEDGHKRMLKLIRY